MQDRPADEQSSAQDPAAPPWMAAPMLDPEGLAAIAERGARDVAKVLSSLLGANRDTSPRSPFGARAAEPATPEGTQTFIAEGFKTVDAYADFFKGLIEQYSRRSTTVSEGAEPLRATAAPGEVVTLEWWILNLTATDAGDVRPVCTAFASPAGQLGPGDLTISPDLIDVLPARSSRAVGVEIAIPGSAEPGVYRAVLQADGLPSAWQVLELTVDTT